MTSKEFKKVGRFLKRAYDELKSHAYEMGVDTADQDFKMTRDRIRKKTLEKLGLGEDEYLKAREEYLNILAKKPALDR